MKISPVQGTPTIPNPSSSGISPEKLEKLKAIASGKPQPEKEEENKDQVLASKTPSITMNTNRNPEPIPSGNESGNGEIPVESAPESAISDTTVQTNAPVEATQPLSPQFAALAKQRRANQVKELELAEREKALSGASRSDLEARIKSQPLSVLQELGVTYDQLTNEILASQSGTNPEILALKAELKALKEGVDKTLSDKDAAQEKAVLTEIRRTVNQMAQLEPYELIRETKSESEVVDLIHRTYKKTGEVLSEDEAMNLVEAELEEEALKIARLKKVQGKLTPPEAPLQPQPTQGIKTLTNKDSARPVTSRRQRAIAAMLGQK